MSTPQYSNLDVLQQQQSTTNHIIYTLFSVHGNDIHLFIGNGLMHSCLLRCQCCKENVVLSVGNPVVENTLRCLQVQKHCSDIGLDVA